MCSPAASWNKQLSTSLHTDLALDALEKGLWTRQRAAGTYRNSSTTYDRGVQYRAVRYTERLTDAEAVASVGSNGDSYNNAMTEALHSLFKDELVRNLGPWKGIDDLEIAVAEYIDWFNHRRLHGEPGHIPPVEAENNFYAQLPAISQMERVKPSLHKTRGLTRAGSDPHKPAHYRTARSTKNRGRRDARGPLLFNKFLGQCGSIVRSTSERSRWDLNSSFQITWQPLGSFWRRFAGISPHPDDDASRENVANCCHFVAEGDGRA